MPESLAEDDEQSFEYDSSRGLPPLVAPDAGSRVYSALRPALLPGLSNTSHCLGFSAAADCNLMRFPFLSVDRYEVPHDLSRDWIV